MAEYFSLTCPTCGGKLEIFDEVGQFACGYCGTEHIVKKDGGIVFIRPIVDGLKTVEKSVEKTASELAIQRLEKEIEIAKSADLKILSFNEKYELPQNSNLSIIYVGLARVLTEKRNGKPSGFLKAINGSGYKDQQLNEVFASLSIDDLDLMISLYQTLKQDSDKGPTSPYIQNLEYVIRDLEELKDLYESKSSLPKKLAEIKEHRKNVRID